MKCDEFQNFNIFLVIRNLYKQLLTEFYAKAILILYFCYLDVFLNVFIKNIHTYLAQTPEIGQGLGRFLSCGARKQEQT